MEAARLNVLRHAGDVFGTDDAAREWMDRPALALNGARPVDLMAADEGIEIVERLLVQLDYCVYI